MVVYFFAKKVSLKWVKSNFSTFARPPEKNPFGYAWRNPLLVSAWKKSFPRPWRRVQLQV